MNTNEAKQELLALITTLKLTEKEIQALKEKAVRWKTRIELARVQGREELLAEAEKEAEKINIKLAELQGEVQTYKNQIEDLRKQMPALTAGERKIDVDLLEQELLMALGKTGEEAETDRAFRKLEKDNAAETALQAMKIKLNQTDDNA